MASYTFSPVAVARTPFHEKFGIPRQPGIVDVPAKLELLEPYARIESIEGLQHVSHLWLTFVFAEHVDKDVNLTVRPPRLGGNKKLGVFSTRSSFRPNPIGLSVVKLDGMGLEDGKIILNISGCDLMDGTPILDIKPYLPYADMIPDAANMIASNVQDKEALNVTWTDKALASVHEIKDVEARDVIVWTTELIQLDPRPAYKGDDVGAEYGMSVFGLNIRWQMREDKLAEVFAVDALSDIE